MKYNLEYLKDDDLKTEITSLISEQLEQVYDLALQNYPDKCCGLILKQGIRPCKNVQNLSHQLDPINYLINSKQRFIFSRKDALFLSRNINSNNPVKAIYYSHSNLGAYFSYEDRQNAVFDGTPIYPVDHLVIDIHKTSIVCSKLFRFFDGDYQLIAVLSGQKI